MAIAEIAAGARCNCCSGPPELELLEGLCEDCFIGIDFWLEGIDYRNGQQDEWLEKLNPSLN